MGEQTVEQEALFYEFSLEHHVPSDHLLRLIDRFVDLGNPLSLAAVLQRDWPSLDPELMIGMLIIGHCIGVRSERPPEVEAAVVAVAIERPAWGQTGSPMSLPKRAQ